ncbi:MAG: DinB family protein [Thiotrichaceae bacterium]|nr:DinB family protein [Thiotrichaceae bacterium]
MEKNLDLLLTEIKRIRTEMGEVVKQVDKSLTIYPGWTIKEMIGHITAWEIVINQALIAYQNGDPPYFLHEQDFDVFNKEAVNHRGDWTLKKVLQEWKEVRAAVIKTIQKLKETDLTVEMVLPWGSERTVAELIEIIGEHESEHMGDAKKATG